jgi:beta-lactam-binding protein with PASTA domain
MSLKQFLLSKTFLKNLLAAAAVVLVVLLIIIQGLKIYTHHGESYPVPDFSGLTIPEIENTARLNNLRYEVIDSVYINEAAPGAVVDQEPEPGFRVKQNRKVFLTINSKEPEKVLLPKLTDISFRQAQVLAENHGIQIGTISYEPSEFNDLVLRVEQDSVELLPGEILTKGSSVDLIVGRSLGNEDTTLPDLTGLNSEMAKNILNSSLLNMGVVIYDRTVITFEDSVNAFVWRQYPSAKNTKLIALGTSVDLWLTTDSLKIEPLPKEDL